MAPSNVQGGGEHREDSILRLITGHVLIVGAGPSGLATAACLTRRRIPYTILERSDCIASVWKYRTYDRLRLMLVKEYCQLPMLPLKTSPSNTSTCSSEYATREEFLRYLKDYARRFSINPLFNHEVQCASYDPVSKSWTVIVRVVNSEQTVRYTGVKWLVVATGLCAENVEPKVEGIEEFRGLVVHASEYKNGAAFRGRKVLVVGCGNTGTEVAADLADFYAKPSLVVRRPVHIIPRNLLGWRQVMEAFWLAALLPTDLFAQQPGPWLSKLSFHLGKVLPICVKDWCILSMLWLKFGSLKEHGMQHPKLGPFASAENHVYPVFETVETLQKIKAGLVKVVPSIEYLTQDGAQFIDGQREEYDALVFATGYKSNVSKWLKNELFVINNTGLQIDEASYQDNDNLFNKDGYLKNPSTDVWKGKRGLYTLGFGKRGFIGMSEEAKCIAEDISRLMISTEI